MSSAFAALSTAVVIGSCGGGDTGFDPIREGQILSIVVEPAFVLLEPGQTETLAATLFTLNGDTIVLPVTWSSSDASVATLSGARVTAVGVGSAMIVATVGGRTGSAGMVVRLPVDPPLVTTPTLPSGVVGERYSGQLLASQGTGAFHWEITAGALPGGLFLATDGALTGTPVDVGTSDFTVRVVSGGETDVRQLSISVFDPLIFTTTSLPFAFKDAPYAQTLSATGGDTTHILVVSGGELPTGLTLSSAGEVSGTPIANGTFSFTAQAASGDGQTATQDLSIRVAIFGSPPVVSTPAVPNGGLGVPYTSMLMATDGDGIYSWALTGGALPPGLGLAADGTISGTPTTMGRSNFTVEVTSAAQTVSADFSVQVFPALLITSMSLPVGLQGRSYSAALAASGGDGTHAWAVTQGRLPFGLNLDADGTLSGTPGVSGSFDVTVEVTSADQTVTAPLSIQVIERVRLARSYLEGGYLSSAYSNAIAPATGGDGDYVYTVTRGALPDGLALDSSTGAISGVAVGVGMSFFEISATNLGSTGSALYTITISTQRATAFNLWGLNVADEIPSAAVQTALNSALARWEATVVGDRPGSTIAASVARSCDNRDDLSDLLTDANVDDVLVLVDIRPIDGVNGILAQAGTCIATEEAPQTVVGRVTLDVADLNAASPIAVSETIWHEIGHVMGIGAFFGGMTWGTLADLDNPRDPRFVGVAANAEYTALGGTKSSIPLEGGVGPGTNFSHWDEGEFDSELMTGIIDVGTNPISRMTIAALSDLGWTVSFADADSYAIPTCSPFCGAFLRSDTGNVTPWEKAPDWGVTVIPGRR